jgi:hypothetical protein
MPEETSLVAVRAAVEAIVPPFGDLPGAADLDVQRHVVEAIEQFLPGFVDLLVTLLDAYANDVEPGAGFAQLDADGRMGVLRTMSGEDDPDMQDIVDGLLVFTYGGYFSEWTGYDRASGTLRPPAVWTAIGYGGPSAGHPDYRKDG